jgi:glycolate oxidase FAD binding subunit
MSTPATCRIPNCRGSDRVRSTPTTADEAREAVAEALSAGATLEILGQGSKRALGRPGAADRVLDMSLLAGVTLYEPGELVLSARAGTKLAEIEALLAAHNQELAFEPMDYARILGGAPGRGTIGGALATNLSGPRRIKAGALRDHVLGVQAVSGRGEAFKAGGRVVKNVTGYDLARGLSGSWGTLAVFTEITVKVMPRAETELTLALPGLGDREAAAALSLAMGSPADISGAAHLPDRVARRIGFAHAVTLMRLEGVAASVAYRYDHLASLLIRVAPAMRLERERSRALWAEIRDAAPLAEPGDRQIWRASLAPMRGPDLVVALSLAGLAPDALYDWGCGLIWLSLPPIEDAGAAIIRAAIREFGGGHATLIRAQPEIRSTIPPFEPQAPALAALGQRLRLQFDPHSILNPGRMAAA